MYKCENYTLSVWKSYIVSLTIIHCYVWQLYILTHRNIADMSCTCTYVNPLAPPSDYSHFGRLSWTPAASFWFPTFIFFSNYSLGWATSISGVFGMGTWGGSHSKSQNSNLGIVQPDTNWLASQSDFIFVTTIVARFEGMYNTFILNHFSCHTCPNWFTGLRVSEPSQNIDFF